MCFLPLEGNPTWENTFFKYKQFIKVFGKVFSYALCLKIHEKLNASREGTKEAETKKIELHRSGGYKLRLESTYWSQWDERDIKKYRCERGCSCMQDWTA